uniref:PDZ domain-containing protein n=1 Tax=Sinocyclocheilus grahami TaxID=75366 RepID=A0A672KA02_SINGR
MYLLLFQGRSVLSFDLEKGESALGISIVGMETEGCGACYSGQVDGRLHEGDQILAVNGKPFESSVTHEQAVQVLLEAASVVTLIIAREPAPSFSPPQQDYYNTPLFRRMGLVRRSLSCSPRLHLFDQ